MDKVSIVCAAYNCAKYIPEMLNSVIRQTHKNWELFVIDDSSNDNTYEIAQKYSKKDSRIKIISNSYNVGPAQTRNKGIKKAQGNYLAFLDADDIWEENFIEKSINFLIQNNYFFCFSSYYRVNEDLKPLYEPFIVPEKINYSDLLKTCPILCSTAVINIDEVGKYYMPDIKKRQDYGLWLNILKNIDYAYGIKEPLATYRIRKGSVSRNKFSAALYMWRVYRSEENLNIFESIYYFYHYTINGIKKYS